MINYYQIFLISVFAAFGALFRYILLIFSPFNLSILNGVFFANTLGCFLMGVVIFISNECEIMSDVTKTALIVGFLGSLTTFSSFGNQFFNFFEARLYIRASAHVILSMSASLISLFIGYWLAKLLLNRFFI